MFSIGSIVLAPRVMHKGEQLNDLRVGTRRPRKKKAVDSDTRPVANAVDSAPIKVKFLAKQAHETMRDDSQSRTSRLGARCVHALEARAKAARSNFALHLSERVRSPVSAHEA